mgnify:CR=1 FL=1
MLKDNVLVRKLTGIETSGSLNILFTDKTGTLTKGKLEVTSVILGNLKEYNEEFEMLNNKKYHDLFSLSVVCNNDSNYDPEKDEIFGGNITDRALLSFVQNKKSAVRRVDSIPFDSKNKYAGVKIDNKYKINLFIFNFLNHIISSNIFTNIRKRCFNKIINYLFHNFMINFFTHSNNISIIMTST